MKLRYARPERADMKVIVGALTITVPPSGIVEVSDDDARAILAKSLSFTVVDETPKPAPKPAQIAPAREDLGPLVRVQVVPAHRSPAGFLIENKLHLHDAQGFIEVPQAIAERWVKQGRAKAAPSPPTAPEPAKTDAANEPAAQEPAKANDAKANDAKAEEKPRGRRGQRAEESTAPEPAKASEPQA